MATYKKFSIKGPVLFRGHDHEQLLQGPLFHDNCKIGFFSEDAWGGPERIDLDAKYDTKAMRITVDKYIYELVSLTMYELRYKEMAAEGYDGLCILARWKMISFNNKGYSKIDILKQAPKDSAAFWFHELADFNEPTCFDEVAL